ncbi:MAG: DUF4358 domain-containing protein [Firmicutes bacterium]|jgi:hypothetical protein|nr:DUF4358 domain-containing protein [Bacillota bacterium]HHX74728.1 DUF4358 domain-containing protein [Bacillota bacterium]
MKKLVVVSLVLICVLALGGCRKQDSQAGRLEESLEDILAHIYANAELDDFFREYLKTGVETVEINSENCSYHLGTEIDFAEAIASVPLMMPSAYELCLVRAKEGADIEALKESIEENVDPQKWVCVGVDPENIIVDNIDDVIILIMSDEQGKALHDAFLALAE